MKGFGRGKGCVFIRQCFVVSNAPSLSTERAVFNEYVMLSWRAWAHSPISDEVKEHNKGQNVEKMAWKCLLREYLAQ